MTGAAVIEGNRATIARIRQLRTVETVPDGEESSLVRELHDGVAQDLATMLLDLEHFRHAQTGRLSVQTQITQLQDQLRLTLTNIRQLIYDRRSLPGVELDFAGTIRRGLAKRFSKRTGIEVKVSVSRAWPRVIGAQAALNLRRIIEEAMTNVARHSGATKAVIRFAVEVEKQVAIVVVKDNGRGFPELDDQWRAGLGLLGIEERAVLLGASAAVANLKAGGSMLTVALPLSALRVQL